MAEKTDLYQKCLYITKYDEADKDIYILIEEDEQKGFRFSAINSKTTKIKEAKFNNLEGIY